MPGDGRVARVGRCWRVLVMLAVLARCWRGAGAVLAVLPTHLLLYTGSKVLIQRTQAPNVPRAGSKVSRARHDLGKGEGQRRILRIGAR